MYIKPFHYKGATGLKVKLNALSPEISKEKSIAQMSSSLNLVGKFSADYDQLIRVGAHTRKTSELPIIKFIFDQVTDFNVKIFWNSNPVDANPAGFIEYFSSVKQRIEDTVHFYTLNKSDYL